MDRFSEIMQTVLKWEGGFVNHPHDPGGATNYGITHEVLAQWRGVASVTPKEVENLTREEAIEIFRHRYWTKIYGERLPPPNRHGRSCQPRRREHGAHAPGSNWARDQRPIG